MSDQSIASIARSLAAAILVAARRDNAHDEQQKKISKLEKELVEAYRAEMVETLRV
jgi:RNA processing factor Prp31